MEQKTPILNHQEVIHKITRMAWQIYEHYSHESELAVGGIQGRGLTLSNLLAEELIKISELKIMRFEILLDKNNKLPGSAKLVSTVSLQNKHLVLVDDVLNSGKTFFMALLAMAQLGPASIKTVVLADRNHKRFPVSADIVGISLSTTLQEHISFNIKENGEMSVWLS